MKSVHETKALILDNAMLLAAAHGFRNITREEVALCSGTAPGTVSYHFKTMKKLQDAVMTAACNKGDLHIIGQGLAEGNKTALALSPVLRSKAAKLLAA